MLGSFVISAQPIQTFRQPEWRTTPIWEDPHRGLFVLGGLFVVSESEVTIGNPRLDRCNIIDELIGLLESAKSARIITLGVQLLSTQCNADGRSYRSLD